MHGDHTTVDDPKVVCDLTERPVVARRATSDFYFTLAFAVIPLWSIVPLSWLYVAHTLYTSSPITTSYLRTVLFFLALCEVVFSIYHQLLACRVAGPSPCGPAHPDEIQVAYHRLLKTGLANLPEDGGDIETLVIDRPGSPSEAITQLDRHDPRAVDFRQAIRTWFLKAPWSSIKRHQMMEWLYWAMYNAAMPKPEDLPPQEQIALDGALELLQRRLGCKVQDGSDPSIAPMRLTIDGVAIFWRPFIFYVLVATANKFLKHRYTTRYGMEYHHSHGLEYLVRVPPNWKPQHCPRPTVLIHGLGLGLLQYNYLITHLLESLTDRPILIPLQPQISQDFFHPHFLKPIGRHEMSERVSGLLQDLGWAPPASVGDELLVESSEESEVATMLETNSSTKGITLLSHSNGSYTHAWMLKNKPGLVGRSAFVDPVTFCSWEGDVCYNFFYRPAKTGIELVMRYFVGTELGVVNYLQRHFDWTANSLWFEEIPNAHDPKKTIFLLGGKDDILHAGRVKRYLTSHGITKNLWYDPEGRHGQALIKGSPGLEQLMNWLISEANEDL